MLPEKLTLAQAVCTRLCHDLGGPVGALGAAIELLEAPRGSDDALEVARDAVRVVDRRLRFLRAAIGGCGDMGPDGIATLSEGLTLGRRVAVDLSALPAGLHLPAPLAQALLLAVWVGTEALPRGGTVRVTGRAAGGICVKPDGAGAAWPAGLPAVLAGEVPAASPRGIAPVLLGTVAAAGRVRLGMTVGDGAATPLTLTAEGS
jgi:histidine phosphotransferase ChpT